MKTLGGIPVDRSAAVKKISPQRSERKSEAGSKTYRTEEKIPQYIIKITA